MNLESLIGVGIYSVPEAARLSGVSAARIRRWMLGYSYSTGERRRFSLPLWHHQLPPVEGSQALSFRDLIEVRFIDAFRDLGLGWKALRIAAEHAADLVRSSHPFSTKKFKTDGKTIFAEIAEESGERSLLDLVQRQYSFREFVDPFLYKGLEFGEGESILRWFPMLPSRRIVIDPAVGFGQPIVDPEGVPTQVFARSVAAEGSVERVANWFEVDPRAVRDAVEFQQRLAA